MFANIPEISWVDSKYRETMSHFWLYCIERGTAIIFEKDKGVTKDKWHLKELEKHMGVIKYFSSLDKLKRTLRKHPTYFDLITFSELGSKVYEDYELVRNARNLAVRVEEMSYSNKDMAKIMCYNLLIEWDRIKLEVNKSKNNTLTYPILRNEIMKDPVQKVPLASETTIRNWIIGLKQYVKSQGKDGTTFDSVSVELE